MPSNGAAAAAATHAPTPGPLACYPGAVPKPLAARLAFLLAHASSTLVGAFQLPRGELWVPVVTSAILAHLVAILALLRPHYLGGCWRACMVLVGLLPKAISLGTYLLWPGEAPSSYFSINLPLEGAIILWQQVMYNYPFWPGMVVLAAHCGLSTAICLTVKPHTTTTTWGARPGEDGGGLTSQQHDRNDRPLFNAFWVLAHTYCCAALAVAVSLQQNRTSTRWLRRCLASVTGGRGGASTAAAGGGATAPVAPAHGTAGEIAACSSNGKDSCGGVCDGGGAAAAVADADTGVDLQLLQVVRKILGGGRTNGNGFVTPKSVSAAGSHTASAATSESPSAAGSGSHAAAAGLAKLSCCTDGAACAADVAAAAPTPEKLPPPPPSSLPVAPNGPPANEQEAAAMAAMQAIIAATASLDAAAAAAAGLSAPTNGSGASSRGGRPTYVPFPAGPARAAAAMPPSGAFSLKQPTGLSKWTIVEDQEFSAPAAAEGVSSSLEAINMMSSRSRRFKRYTSRAVPPQRVYMKIPWAEPDQLPGNFLERLNQALSEGLDYMAVGVAARPGCIELVLDIVPHAASDSANDRHSELSRRSAPRRLQPQDSHPHPPPHQQARPTQLQSTSSPQPAPNEQYGGDLQAGLVGRLVTPAAVDPPDALRGSGDSGLDRELRALGGTSGVSLSQERAFEGGDGGGGGALASQGRGEWVVSRDHGALDGGGHCRVDSSSSPCLLDSHGALEEAVLSGLLLDSEPASWIDALHLQPPPGAEVLAQACGRVWISRWDHTQRQWVPQKAGDIRPSQLPRITRLHPPCILLSNPAGATAAAAAATATTAAATTAIAVSEVGAATGSAGPLPSSGAAAAAAAAAACCSVSAAGLTLVVSNADSEPSFSARCRGRYLPVAVQDMHWPQPGTLSGPDPPTAPPSIGPGPQPQPQPQPKAPWEADAAAQAPVQAPFPPAAAAVAAQECDDDSAFLSGRVRGDGGLAVVQLELPGGLPRNGLVVVECKVGKLLSNWRPVLITEDPQFAEELATLYDISGAPEAGKQPVAAEDDRSGGGAAAAAAADAADPMAAVAATAVAEVASWDELLTDLGLWLDYVEVLGLNGRRSSGSGVDGEGASGGGGSAGASGALARQAGSLDFGPGLAALYGTDRYRQHMAGIGVSLLEFAVDRGWTHTAELLVRQMLSAGVSWGEMLQRCSDGLTLLHRAVRSAVGDMVKLVVALGEELGTPFDWQAAASSVPDGDGAELATGAGAGRCGGGDGITPLHLAAALPDGGRLAERILSEYEAACALWATALDSHGMRPVDCARASGHLHLHPCLLAGPEADKQSPRLPAPPAGESGAASAAFTPSTTTGSSFGGHLSPVSDAAGATAKTPAAADDAASASASASTASASASASASDASTDFGGVVAGGGGGSGRGAGAVVRAAIAALRCLAALLAAPLVNARRAEALYLQAVGARYVLWSCCYLVLQTSMVVAVAGRMVKEGRAHEMAGMLVFFSPHLASALLLCLDYGAWLALREPLCAAVTVTRSLAKLLPVLDVLPYPQSSSKYLLWGMDVLIEGLLPALFEHMRTPLVLLLRAFEGVATGLLYDKFGIFTPLSYALSYALAWTLGSGLLTVCLDARHRRVLMGPEWASRLPDDQLPLPGHTAGVAEAVGMRSRGMVVKPGRGEDAGSAKALG